MAFLNITVDTVEVSKSMFFDRGHIEAMLGKGEAKALSKMGAYVRTTAKGSLKYATKKNASSLPGQPPRVHRGQMFTSKNKKTGVTAARSASPLKELIYFTFDSASKSVVIGPAKFKPTVRTPVPAVLEHGGTAVISIEKFTVHSASAGTGRKATIRQAENYRRKLQNGTLANTSRKTYRIEKTIPIAKRPFVGPALQKNLSKFAGLFANLQGLNK